MPVRVIYAKPPQALSAAIVVRSGPPGGGGTAQGPVCPVQMASAAPATPIAPTAADAASRSAAKTPAARPLIGHLCSVKKCISLKDLTETWQAQSEYLQEAEASGTLKEGGARPLIRSHVLKGMCVLQTLLGQSNTQHRSRRDGIEDLRSDTQGGLVSAYASC